MQQPINPKSEMLLPDYSQSESENTGIRIGSFPKSHPFFRTEPFWRIRINSYLRTEHAGNK